MTQAPGNRQALALAFADRVFEVANTLLPAIPPIMVPNKAKNLEVVGSGVLVRVGPSEFLVTAAHVMDQARHGLHIAGPSNVVHISGKYAETTGAANRARDKIDLALFPLSEREVVQLRDARFINVLEFEVTSVSEPRPPGDEMLLLIGYPVSRQPHPQNAVVDPRHFYYIGTEGQASEYSRLEWNVTDTVLMTYEKKHTLNRLAQRVTTPDPYGMSGGGVFRLFDRKLVAVPIHYLGRQHNLVAATRAIHIIHGLRQRFKHVTPRFLQK